MLLTSASRAYPNLLKPATHAPNGLAHAYLFGEFNYNTHPLAPLGTAVDMHLVPTAREMWLPHSATGYHMGISFEHYRCYRIWIKETRAKMIGNTVFFKHKYLTMPTITNADALLIAGKDMQSALKGAVPQVLHTTDAVKQLMKIFKANAEAAKAKEQTSESQRVQRETAFRERLELEEALAREEAKIELSTEEPQFEIVPTTSQQEPIISIPVVSQVEEDNGAPAANTRAQRRIRTLQDEANVNLEATMIMVKAAEKRRHASLLQQALATKLDIAGDAIEVTARKAASKRYPLQVLCDLVNAVLDDDTGKMLEYRHLIAWPKYKQV